MHILVLAMQFGASKNGDYIGGSTNNIVRLTKYLVSDNNQVTIIASPPKFPDYKEQYQWGDVHYVHPRGKFMGLMYIFGFFIGAIITLLRLRQTLKPDVIHGHSAYPIFGILLRVASRILGASAILTIYSPLELHHYSSRSLIGSISKYILKFIFLRNIWLIPTSKFVKRSLFDANLSPLEEIYPIVDLDKFKVLDNESKKSCRMALGLIKSSIAIFYLGNLRKNKGLFDLLSAIELVRKINRNVNLVILLALDMPSDESHQILSNILRQKSLYDITKHIGITSNVGAIMASADIVVIPFHNTFGPADPPLSILESLASGSTVLTTEVGGMSEIVSNGENGFLVPPKNRNILAQQITELISNPSLREKVAVKAPSIIQSLCHPNVVGRLHIHVYKQIARRASKR